MGAYLLDGIDDNIVASSVTGPMTSLPNGAWTVGFLIKRGTALGTFDGLGYLLSSFAARAGLSMIDGGQLRTDIATNGGSNSDVALLGVTSPYMVFASRPSGTNQNVTYRWKEGSAGAWDDISVTSGIDNDAASCNTAEFGMWEGSDPFEGYLSIASWWNVELTQGQVEACDNNWRTSDFANCGVTPISLTEFLQTTPVDYYGRLSSWAVNGATWTSGETMDGWNFDGLGPPDNPLIQPYILRSTQRWR